MSVAGQLAPTPQRLADIVAGPEADEALIARIARRDQAAFEAFYRRHYLRTFRFVGRVTRSPELVEEVVNEAMMVVWDKASGFRAEARPSSWLLGIAYRLALRRLRRTGPERAAVPLDDVDLAEDSSIEETSRRLQLGRLLRDAMAGLSPAHRAVVELTYYQGMSVDEVANLLSCPAGTVKTRMMHARRRLKGLLAARAVDGFEVVS